MISVVKPGLFTTIQDTGRFGYRNIGVPVSGAMDHISAGLANELLNNSKNDAVLEMTMIGPILKFLKSTEIAITGANMSPILNETSIENNRVYQLRAQDIVTFRNATEGVRSYLAIRGGFKSELVLNSRSYFEGITSSFNLKKKDVLLYDEFSSPNSGHKGFLSPNPFYQKTNYLDVTIGPDAHLFKKSEIQLLLNTKYTLSGQINRMGYRLENIILPHKKSILTSPVLPGTVQLTPAGQLIILMKDAQTTGGYPRVLQLSEKAVSILAQKWEGMNINFNSIGF